MFKPSSNVWSCKNRLKYFQSKPLPSFKTFTTKTSKDIETIIFKTNSGVDWEHLVDSVFMEEIKQLAESYLNK